MLMRSNSLRHFFALHKEDDYIDFNVQKLLPHKLSGYNPGLAAGDINGDGQLSPSEKEAVSTLRPVYLTILISHIILAAGVLPLILLSFYRGLQMQVEKHRKLVRWAFPIWLYVTVTGVIVYLMISPYYHF